MNANLVGMLRVKNEARWIEEVLVSVQRATPLVVLFDDHSTDETTAIARRLGVEVLDSPFEGIDEARDKDFLLAHIVAKHKPDWVLQVDGDEVLAAADVPRVMWACSPDQDAVDAYSLQVVYLWDRPDQIRTDGIYGRFFRPSLFRSRGSSNIFRRTRFGGNFHCSSVPDDRILGHMRLHVRLKHYGYMDRELRLAKYGWYNSIDPANDFEDRYRHMVQGDVEEVPAGAVLKHAGPLTLQPWTE